MPNKITDYQLRQKESLTKKELNFFRLMMHDMTPIEISDFLEVSLERLFYFRRSIMLKLGCKTWHDTILKAFKIKVLKKEDYTPTEVKACAIKYAQLIMSEFFVSKVLKVNGFELHKKLEKLIITFYRESESEVYKTKNEKFSQKEKMLLQLRYEGSDCSLIEEKLNLKDSELVDIDYMLLLKLEVESWFNSFKKAFQFRLIDKKKYKHQRLIIEVETIECAAKIITMMTFDNLTAKEKELVIYTELVNLYNTIEYDYLLN